MSQADATDSKRSDITGLPGRYWHALDDGRLQCDLCPRFCKLRDAQRGLCFVRGRRNDQILLTTYGRSSGFCIDPVEKKPLYHFLPGTPALSFGTAGCNLACKFCQNWDITKTREFDRLQAAASPGSIAAMALSTKSRSVAFTYNDPLIFLEYAVDTAAECRERGIHTIAVSAGYVTPEPREEFFRYMDAANIDLKAFTDHFYRKICGGHLRPVLDTLLYLRHETAVWLELTTLLIPGENDTVAEIEEMTQWIVQNLGPDVPLHFSAFFPSWKMMEHTPTPQATLIRSRDIARRNGLRYVYTGNVRDPQTSSTYCPNCGGLLIGRDGYQLEHWNLLIRQGEAECGNCSAGVAGVFEEHPGTWGDCRQPVQTLI